jgi:hypothetical protein
MRLTSLMFAAVIIGLVFAGGAAAQNVPAAFTEARNQRMDAIFKGDRATFERFTTDNFVTIDPEGRVETKVERASRITPPATPRSGPNPLMSGRQNEHISMYNNNTLVLSWQTQTPNGTQNFMETWVLDSGQWKCAGAHVSRPAEAARAGGRGGRG